MGLEQLLIGAIPAVVPLVIKGLKMFVEQVLVGRLPVWALHLTAVGLGAVATAFEPFSNLSLIHGSVLGLSGVGAHQAYSHALSRSDTKKR